MSIEELQKIQKENDKIEGEEKKLSTEEMSKRWGRLECEANQLDKMSIVDGLYRHIPRMEKVYSNIMSNIRHRINEAIRIIKERISEYNIV